VSFGALAFYVVNLVFLYVVGYDCDLSGKLDFVKLCDFEFLRGTTGQDRELVQSKFVFVIAASDQPIDRNNGFVAERTYGGRGRVHDRLIT
jgi:hypothetical protein